MTTATPISQRAAPSRARKIRWARHEEAIAPGSRPRAFTFVMGTNQHPIGSGHGERTTAREVAAGADLTGKQVVITGGYAGLGLETTRVLAERGAAIIAGARDVAKATANLADIPGVAVRPLDLADHASIDRFADGVLATARAIDLLINNAGIMATPLTRDARGYELQFATNHLGHFQLTNRPLPALERRR